MRLAWFSPLPPDRSGIAAYSVELLVLLSRGHEIDAFVEMPLAISGDLPPALEPALAPDSPETLARRRGPDLGPRVHVLDAHEFAGRQARHPYDLVIYQLGNDLCHDFMWPYMVRYPGLVVVHDGQLHQARAKALTWKAPRADDYRAEFAYSHPGAPDGVADLVVAGLGKGILHLWPMMRIPVESARLVSVHSAWLADELRGQFPGVAVTRIRMGVTDPLPAARAARREVRARHGIRDEAVVFAAFGRVTPEKRLTPLVEAIARVAAELPLVRLMVVGEQVDYFDLVAAAAGLGIADRLIMCGYVDDERLPEYLAAADVDVCLRWPTSRETSASWLRCAASGRPTIVDDLAHTCDLACLDPRTMELLHVSRGGGPAPVPLAMAVDLTDEAGTLEMSVKRLGADPALRERLGAAAREYWRREATLEVSVGDYEAAIASAISAPAPVRPRWPKHLRADRAEHAREATAALGLSPRWL